MQFIYNFNSLPFFNEKEIILKNFFISYISLDLKEILKKQNRAWDFIQIEAPSLIPRNLISENYTNEDLWIQESINHSELVLKPETTPSTYAYMLNYIEHQSLMPPICFWQASKSFRREQDQASKHCRFKEFYQLEFQCLYSQDSKNNYQEAIIEDLATMFMNLLALPTRILLSDRLPNYSLKTIDIEVFNGDKWMEICSVSLRKDFPINPIIKNKSTPCYVLEIALGLDRLIYNYTQKTNVFPNLKVDNLL